MSQVIPLGPASRMLTTREAAARLGVSLRTVQLWVEASILPAARTPGGHRRIPYNAVEALAMSMGLVDMPLGAAVRASTPSVAQAARTQHVPWRVLLVSHHPQWLAAVARALEVFGHSLAVETADNGYLGLLQIGRQAPHLLITGLELRGMDGIVMLQTLERCETLGDMQVLALVDDPAAVRGLPASVEVLSTPVSPEAVAVRVGRWLLARQTAVELHQELHQD